MPSDDTNVGSLSKAERQLVDALKDGKWVLSLHREFENFDPLNTPVTDFPLAGYARQAREILSVRSNAEIRYAVMIAEWGVQSRLGKDALELGGQSFNEWANFIGQPDETLPRILQRRRALIYITNLADLPNAKWQEIFAALTLAYVARATNNGRPTSSEAAESIQIALSFFERTQAARQKDAEWRGLVLAFSQGKDRLSADKIAGMFDEEFKTVIQEKRGKMLLKRTVADWIRKARRSARSNPTV